VEDPEVILGIMAAIAGASTLPKVRFKPKPTGPDTSMCDGLRRAVQVADAEYNMRVAAVQALPIDAPGREAAVNALNAARAAQEAAAAALAAHPQCVPS
jgi:hypothetical protein